MAGLLERAAVQRVQAALRDKGSRAEIIELETTARSAEDAARSLGVEVGAIVKSLVFLIDGDAVMALIAGDRRCDTAALPAAFGRGGLVLRADADKVREVSGFAIGGVAPVAHPRPLPTAIDDSLQRFERVFAAAGHPHCVFATTAFELSLLTGGAIAKGIAT